MPFITIPMGMGKSTAFMIALRKTMTAHALQHSGIALVLPSIALATSVYTSLSKHIAMIKKK